MSLFAARQQLSSRGYAGCEFHTAVPLLSSTRSFSQVSTHYWSWEARSFLQNWTTLFLSFWKMDWRDCPLLPSNTVFKAQFWFVGSGEEQEEKQRKLCFAFNMFVSCHCQKSAQMDTRVSLTHWAGSLEGLVLGDAVSKHLRFLMSPHHSLSGFLSPQEKMGIKDFLAPQGVVNTNTWKT